MINITIIGGGIAGLSAATILSEIPNIKISIYEKKKQIGGQAASQYNGTCYSEYSWRIFGASYLNLMHIFKKLNILKNFDKLKYSCFVKDNKSFSAEFSFFNQLYHIIKDSNIQKILDIFLQSKERVINEYQNVSILEYTDNNPVVKAIIGPALSVRRCRTISWYGCKEC